MQVEVLIKAFTNQIEDPQKVLNVTQIQKCLLDYSSNIYTEVLLCGIKYVKVSKLV